MTTTPYYSLIFDALGFFSQMGFLWSWNHMISRRWRTIQNLDVFQMRLLRDFKEFCENKDQRLKIFWERCWELKEDACTLPV